LVNQAQKTPIAATFNLATQQKVLDQIALEGKALPAAIVAVSGWIVTVSFDVQGANLTLPNVTCPIANSKWIREPVQIGDQGIVEPADVSLGGISGLGTGTAALSPVGNLSALVWKPVGNANWTTPADPNSAFVSGPNGVVLQDASGACIVTVNKTSGLTVAIGGTTILTINASGLAVPSSADVTVGTISSKTHLHNGVTTGSGDTGPPQG